MIFLIIIWFFVMKNKNHMVFCHISYDIWLKKLSCDWFLIISGENKSYDWLEKSYDYD